MEALIGRIIPEEKKKPSEKKKSVDEDISTIELPFIDGVNWKHAMLKLKTEALLMDSIKNFSNMAQMDMKVLDGMYEKVTTSGDQASFDEYRIKVHSMKSNVATIGADHVADPVTKDIPVVFLTGVSDKNRISEVVSLNPKPAGYLLKPIDADILKETISKLFK